MISVAVYAYNAVDLDASSVRGTVIADTPRQARDNLRARGLTVQEVKPVEPPRELSWWQRQFSGRYSAKSVAFARELATLLSVGMPLLEAIDTIAKQHKGGFKSALLILRDRVSEGQSLAEAMKQQPLIFEELFVHIAEVGENSGNLEVVLEQLAEFKDRSLQFKNRITSALLYPLIVLATGVGVGLFLMSFVVPKLLAPLLDSGKELPGVTKWVKGASDLLVERWWLLLAIAGVVVFGLSALLRTHRGRWAWHKLHLQLPGVGELTRKQALVRMAVIIATLMRSGIVFLRAIEIAQRSTGNLVLRDALAKCQTAVQGGQDIAKALEATNAFPALVVQIFSVGQQAGRLEEMLDRLAVDYDRQVATAAQRFTAVLEPLLILVLAVIVGFIAFATILPILEAGNVL
jgi:type II secretory pathway component PulF